VSVKWILLDAKACRERTAPVKKPNNRHEGSGGKPHSPLRGIGDVKK